MQATPLSTINAADQLIKKWLDQRQEMIVSLHQLCSLRPFGKTTDLATISSILETFCQQLVDYVSLGHFEIFEHIIQVVELCHHPLASVPQKLLHSLLQITIVALDFNDQYQDLQKVDALDVYLSFLAEQLAQRLEWEDQLLEIYSLARAWKMYPAKIA